MATCTCILALPGQCEVKGETNYVLDNEVGHAHLAYTFPGCQRNLLPDGVSRRLQSSCGWNQ